MPVEKELVILIKVKNIVYYFVLVGLSIWNYHFPAKITRL
jgi:hypothetical protein